MFALVLHSTFNYFGVFEYDEFLVIADYAPKALIDTTTIFLLSVYYVDKFTYPMSIVLMFSVFGHVLGGISCAFGIDALKIEYIVVYHSLIAILQLILILRMIISNADMARYCRARMFNLIGYR